jgi:ubiquinone/menaquinone biosynthesis C-methylase UbiE
MTTVLHPDPFRSLDVQPDPRRLIQALEERGRMPSHARLRRRFLRFAGVPAGGKVLEVGCGTGVVLRDLARMVGPRGRVVGVDTSRLVLDAAGRLLDDAGLRPRITLRRADAARLPFAAGRFDAAVAVTVLLHVAEPAGVVAEMTRVVRPGGIVAVQDQDFGTIAVTHPDRPLTERILGAVAAHIYEEPWSGRRLPGLLRAAGLADVRLLTDVYQDTTLEPYSKTFLERRAEHAVRFGLVEAAAAQRWLDALTTLVAAGAFVLTINFYGAVGVKAPAATRARRRPR